MQLPTLSALEWGVGVSTVATFMMLDLCCIRERIGLRAMQRLGLRVPDKPGHPSTLWAIVQWSLL